MTAVPPGLDALTGLPDAAALHQALGDAVKSDRSSRTVSAVMRVNLDSFDGFNKWYGTACGDAVLKEVARRLRDTAYSSCIVVRVADDDFALLVPGMLHPGSLPDLADAILRAITYPVLFDGMDYRISASAGIALCRLNSSDGGNAFERAGDAVEASKSRGGNTMSIAPLE